MTQTGTNAATYLLPSTESQIQVSGKSFRIVGLTEVESTKHEFRVIALHAIIL